MVNSNLQQIKPVKTLSVLSILSLVLGLFGITYFTSFSNGGSVYLTATAISSVAAVIFGIFSLIFYRKRQTTLNVMVAILGIVLGLLIVVFMALLIVGTLYIFSNFHD